MYLEVCEGKMDVRWKNTDPVSYHIFREQLSTQMLLYDPRKRLYPGEKLIRVLTKQLAHARPGCQTKEKVALNEDGMVSAGQYLAAKKGGKKAQLCVDIHQFNHHCESVIHVAKNLWACYVCGECTYTRYGV